MHRARFTLWVGLLVLVMMPALLLAKAPKKYQVTGKILEVSADMIVVDKDGEKWEISRSADTKVDGDLKVGAKVTIEYRMAAATVEVKDGSAKPADKAPEKKK